MKKNKRIYTAILGHYSGEWKSQT